MKHIFYTVYYTKDDGQEEILDFETYEQAFGIYLMFIENKVKSVDLRKVIVDDNSPYMANVIKLDTHAKEPTEEELLNDPRWKQNKHFID